VSTIVCLFFFKKLNPGQLFSLLFPGTEVGTMSAKEEKKKKKKKEIPPLPKPSASSPTSEKKKKSNDDEEEEVENGSSRSGNDFLAVSSPKILRHQPSSSSPQSESRRVSSMRASSCDSLGVMFAEQMRLVNGTASNDITHSHGSAVRNIPSKSTLLEEDEDEKKSGSNSSTMNNIQGQQQNDRNSEIFLNTDQIPYEKATVLTKLQKWGDYESCGESVGKTKFVPMKTPLSLEFLERTEKYAHILTVEKMLYEQRETKQREVTMIIDLSNHECLYEEDIPKEVHRVHVRNIAKSIPNIECCATVMREANKHWKKHPEEYIAIHCAYGFNRTGFIVCCYLIEKENMTAEEALETFAVARPPGVKHERFQMALKARYPTRGCKPKLTEYDEDEDNETKESGAVKNETVEGVNASLRINRNNSSAGKQMKKSESLVRKLFNMIKARRRSRRSSSEN
jgi:protein-tyrosine phosphatase